VLGDDLFIGGYHVLALGERPGLVLTGRVLTANGLDNYVNARLIEELVFIRS
jgi:hypothetical protein